MPKLVADHANRLRRIAVLTKSVDGAGPYPLHAVVKNLCHGRPPVLERQRPGHRPRPHEHDPHRPPDPWHLPVRQRRRQARGDLPVVLMDERCAENAPAPCGKTRQAGPRLAEKDLPEGRHRQPHHRRPDHRVMGSRPAFPRRLQRCAAGSLPIQPAHVRAFHAARPARRTARDFYCRR